MGLSKTKNASPHVALLKHGEFGQAYSAFREDGKSTQSDWPSSGLKVFEANVKNKDS